MPWIAIALYDLIHYLSLIYTDANIESEIKKSDSQTDFNLKQFYRDTVLTFAKQESFFHQLSFVQQ